MKTENNYQNKNAFHAQYWGQRVFYYHRNFVGNADLTFHVQSGVLGSATNGDSIIELRCLGSITADEAIECAEIVFGHDDVYVDKNNIALIKTQLKRFAEYTPCYQYLQSKSFALPWRDLSVDDLISYGWITLKDK